VLATVARLNQKLNAAITLIHVIERNAPESVHGERHLTKEEDACNYLTEMAEKWFPAETHVERHVHTEEVENVAASIVSHAGELAQDLIVMCAHGNSGLHDWVMGNIAQQVISQGKTPVLLLHPEISRDSNFDLSEILIAHDGVIEHESGLPLVARLAQQFNAHLRLLQVVPTLGTLSSEQAASGRLLPGATSLLLEIAETDAAAHLQEHAYEWEKTYALSVDVEIRRGDPANQVVASAREHKADLIVIGTHGKAGMKAFWAGSVASKIIAQAGHFPLLLIPVNLALPPDNH
ncbi:MAG: universal stress protein, partial [Anaerolineae bacterium]|nr:universal stress protein [Anaerolineae bacterium]